MPKAFRGSKHNVTYRDDNTGQRGNKEGSQLHFDDGFETMRLRRVLQRKRRYLDCQNYEFETRKGEKEKPFRRWKSQLRIVKTYKSFGGAGARLNGT